MKKILIIEDDQFKRSEIEEKLKSVGLKTLIMDEALVKIIFDDTTAPEDKLTNWLKENADEISLVLVDHDLSKLYSIISESVITTACNLAFVPVCHYARMINGRSNNLIDAMDCEQLSIRVEVPDNKSKALQIHAINDGFTQILEILNNQKDKSNNKTNESENNIFSFIWEKILQQGGHDMQIRNYNKGISISELIKLKDLSSDDRQKSLSCIIGYWLYNIVLQFPGIILNRVATYSYLNIDEQDFQEYECKFKDARYNGPFSSVSDFWWKDQLDYIVTNDCWDGQEFLQKKDIIVKNCKCSKNPELDAGYYCIIHKLPISDEHSYGNIDWLPKGAILSRVNKEDYDHISPLL